MRRRAKPAKAKVEAKSTVARESSKNDGARVRDLEKRLAEALKGKADALRDKAEARDQQTATSEILKVISRMPSDVQPVFDIIAESAARLCDAIDVTIFQVDSNVLRVVVHRGPIPSASVGQTRPMVRGTTAGRAVLDRRTIHVADVQAETDEYPEGSVRARSLGHRTILAAPLLHVGEAIGAIAVRRTDVRPFTERQVDLLHTFADQAVIAIENVRLFKETKEALEQQTATSAILRVISSSPTDVQPVFDAVLASGVRLCGALFGGVFRFDGQLIHFVTSYQWPAQQLEAVGRYFPMPPGDGSLVGRAIRDRRVVQTPDYQAEAHDIRWVADGDQRPRSTIAIPMLREGNPIGGIVLARAATGLFSDEHIALLQTFADQAVIAIENVRLFNELQETNRALTASLEQQTATSEVLRAIAHTQTDAQPVFDTIVKSVARLCDGMFASVHRFDGELLHWVAQHNYTTEGLEAMRRGYPMPAGRDTASGRAVIDRTVIHIRDFESDPDVPVRSREIARAFGYRSLITVPMLRESQPVGAIAVARRDGPFSAGQIALLQMFADQAVIAIENVRLFNDLELANRGLQSASQHKSEFLANMSHELRTPLNAIIGFSEVLGERMFGELNEKQDEYLKDIYASGRHLLSLINDILDLSKIEAGRMELELTDFNLPATLDNALTLVRERAGRRGIALGLTIDERLEQIRADERKVRQVVLNLLSNAIKFTPEGGRIDVRAVPVDGSVEVSVSDTGVGIAPEDQEAIFEEFRQVGTAAKKVEGTGLGLALSRKFVELHGGRIWVESQTGAGSTFTFTIPTRIGA